MLIIAKILSMDDIDGGCWFFYFGGDVELGI